MKRSIFSILCIASSFFVQAQDSLFSKVVYVPFTFIDAVATSGTPQKGMYLAGSLSYDQGVIMQLDSLGNQNWSKKLSFNSLAAPDIEFKETITCSDGSTVSVGRSINDAHQQYEGFVVKLDANGNLLWNVNLALNDTSYYTISSIQETTDFGYVVSGNFDGNDKFFIAKLNQAGNLVWSTILSNVEKMAANSIAVGPDNSIYVLGTILDLTNAQHAFITKVADNGTHLWTQKYDNKEGLQLAVLNDGLLALTYDMPNYQLSFMKTDFDGVGSWYKIMFGQSTQQASLAHFQLLSDSSIALMNPSDFDAQISKLNPDLTSFTASSRAFLKGVSMQESANKTLFVIGNGPILGVKTLYEDHIGMLKVDSNLFNDGACISPGNPFDITTEQLTGSSYTVDIETGIVASNSPLTVTDLALNYQLGCVQFFGGLEEESLADLVTIFPTVSSGEFTLTQKTNSALHFTVYNALGQKVNEVNSSELTFKISISNQPEGIYFFTVTDPTNRSMNGKLVVLK